MRRSSSYLLVATLVAALLLGTTVFLDKYILLFLAITIVPGIFISLLIKDNGLTLLQRTVLAYPLGLLNFLLIFLLNILGFPLTRLTVGLVILLLPLICCLARWNMIKKSFRRSIIFLFKIQGGKHLDNTDRQKIKQTAKDLFAILALLILCGTILHSFFDGAYVYNGDFFAELHSGDRVRQNIEEHNKIMQWSTDAMGGYPPYQYEGFITYMLIGIPNLLMDTSVFDTINSLYFLLFFLPALFAFVILRYLDCSTTFSLFGGILAFLNTHPIIASGQVRHLAAALLFISGAFALIKLLSEKDQRYVYFLALIILTIIFSISRSGAVFAIIIAIAFSTFSIVNTGAAKRILKSTLSKKRYIIPAILIFLVPLFWVLPFATTLDYLSQHEVVNPTNTQIDIKSTIVTQYDIMINPFLQNNTAFMKYLFLGLILVVLMTGISLRNRDSKSGAVFAVMMSLLILPLIHILSNSVTAVNYLNLLELQRGYLQGMIVIIFVYFLYNSIRLNNIPQKSQETIRYAVMILLIVIILTTISPVVKRSDEYISLKHNLNSLRMPYLIEHQDQGRLNLYGIYFAPYLSPTGMLNNHPVMDLGMKQAQKHDFLFPQRDYINTHMFPFEQNIYYTINNYRMTYTKYILTFKCDAFRKDTVSQILKQTNQFDVIQVSDCMDLFILKDSNFAELTRPVYIDAVKEDLYSTPEAWRIHSVLDQETASKYGLPSMDLDSNVTIPVDALEFDRPSDEKIIINHKFTEESWVVVKEAYYPYWTARTDNGEVPLLETSFGLMLAKPGVSDKLILEYKTPPYQKALALLALICLIASFALMAQEKCDS